VGARLREGVQIAGRYRLVRELSRGGMGCVWIAHHLALDMPCVLKFINSDVAHLSELSRRFEREAKAAAKLRSPHVVQMLDHGVWEGIPFMAMELLEGEDLGRRLARHGRLSASDTVAILTDVALGLAKAHELRIVHRDLKPANIFLVRNDDRDHVKILDFGVAKSLGMDIGDVKTSAGALLGTPYYMSPEQAEGTGKVDHRSDLWSLAVVAFRCVTGRLPFQSTAIGDLLLQIVHRPVPVPSAVAANVPSSFDSWWARAAARSPDQRFQSAREFVATLAVALREQPDSAPEPHGTPCPAVPHVTPTALLVPYVAPTLGEDPAPTAQPVSTTVANHAQGRRRIVWALSIGAVALCASVTGFNLLTTTAAPIAATEPVLIPQNPAAGDKVDRRVDDPSVAATSEPRTADAGVPDAPAAHQPGKPDAGQSAPHKAQRPDCSRPTRVDERGIEMVRRECLP